MRFVVLACVSLFGLGACAASTEPPVAPQGGAPSGQWGAPPPMTPGAAPGAMPMAPGGMPPGAMPPPSAMPPGQPAPAAQNPWGALFPLPGFGPPAAPQAPSPQGAPAPPPAFPTGLPAFPFPAGWPGAPAPAAPPGPPAPPAAPGAPAMPAGFPAIPGMPALWPQGAPPSPLPIPGQPAPAPPGAKTFAGGDVAQRCVDDINGYRASKGLAPLARWGAGEACATQEAGDDSRSQRPHGSFGACRESSQNACPNWSGPAERMTDDCLRMMWSEGPGAFPAHGHYNNMVDTRVTKVACGTFAMPDGRLWAVQDFQ